MPGNKPEITVLLAEGDALTASLLGDRMAREQWTVVHVTTGDEAGNRLNTCRFELAVINTKLAGKSGFELLHHIRSSSSRMPVIILSSSANEQNLVRAFELGADDFMFKPFSPVEFMARARRLLEMKEA